MNKTVITSSGNTLDSNFDMRFGRAAWFCILDEQTGVVEFIENKFANDNHGAGTKVAENMIELKVTKAISGDFGPKAKELLDKFKVQMVVIQDETTVKQVIDKLSVKFNGDCNS